MEDGVGTLFRGILLHALCERTCAHQGDGSEVGEINAPEELNMGSRERSSWFIFDIKRVPQMRFVQVKTAHGTQYQNCNR